MIASLSIENFALIDRLSVDFTDGFTIITGETGAGKSILLDALGLVLGQRADLSALMDKQRKCIVEAQFRLTGYDLKPFFDEHDWDYEEVSIIRREILPGGKSRAFVNDTPVNLADLQELAGRLIDVHSQHQTMEIADSRFQFEILDAVAGNGRLLRDYRGKLAAFKNVDRELSDARQARRDALKESDYHTFLLEELLAARLEDGQQQTLEAEYEKGSNVETIRQHLDKAMALAQDEQYGIVQALKEFRGSLQKISGFSTEYQALYDRAQSLTIELDDMLDEIQASADNLQVDPVALQQIGERLQTIYALQKKHQVNSIAELLEIQQQLDERAVSVAGLEDRIAQLESQRSELLAELEKLASELTAGRTKAITPLTKELTRLLSALGMPHVQFKLDLQPAADFNPTGKDTIQFLFSANKGSDFGPLKKVASGGERSRIMLAVKYILATHANLPSIIFDEIDTGVSGEMADAMGEIMKGMSGHMQVFAITHLPQIAAKGDKHYKVSKVVEQGRTTSTLNLLEHDARVIEIAQMLSGSAVSDSAINHARALLN